MRATVLVDNITARDLDAEWGLSFYLEYQGHVILLDTGASDLFARNADTLGLSLTDVEFGVLSHAHWDHANGMAAFFLRNKTAPFYLRQECGETCYDKTPDGWQYEGIKKGLLSDFSSRIRWVCGKASPIPGVVLLPHNTPNLERRGQAHNMYLRKGNTWVPDNFAHEQSLIFSTSKGLVIFNSCCHAGADTIIRETAAAFPTQPIHAIVGGFHLYDSPEKEIHSLAHRLQETGVTRVVTGHCTGQPAYDILVDVLGERVQQLSTGLVLDF